MLQLLQLCIYIVARAGIKTRCELCYDYYNYVFILWLVLVLKLGVNCVVTITTMYLYCVSCWY